MKGLFQKYFPNDSAQWVRDAFNTEAPAEFSSAEEEQLESPDAVYSSGTGGILGVGVGSLRTTGVHRHD